jgi:ATP-dependent NAD(P)H-hydrate dehydratase
MRQVGPGLGRDPLIQETVARLLRRIASQADTLKLEQIIIDADGLWLLKQDPSLVQQLPAKRLVLTPNLMEFRRLCDAVGISDVIFTVDCIPR